MDFEGLQAFMSGVVIPEPPPDRVPSCQSPLLTKPGLLIAKSVTPRPHLPDPNRNPNYNRNPNRNLNSNPPPRVLGLAAPAAPRTTPSAIHTGPRCRHVLLVERLREKHQPRQTQVAARVDVRVL